MGKTRVMLMILSLATILSCFILPSEAGNTSSHFYGKEICSDHVLQVQSNRTYYVWSEDFPREYRNNTACTMTLAAPENHRMEVRFLQFLTEKRHDVLSIYDGNSSCARLIGNFSGYQNSTRMHSSSDSLTLTFFTDDSVQAAGFNISVRAVQLPGQRSYPKLQEHFAVYGKEICSDHVLQVQSNRTYYVWSKDFPLKYRDNTACTMTLAAPENHRMEVRFLQFLTEKRHDVLSIYDGNSSCARLIGSFSGYQNNTRMHSSSDSLTLTFFTDDSVQAAGFNISVRAVQLPGQRVASSPILRPRNPVRQDLLDSVIRLKQKITDDYVNVSRELDLLMVSVARQSPDPSRMSIGTRVSDMESKEIQKGEAPYMLLLRSSNASNEESLCSAFLVRTRWVITAAHCFPRNFSDVSLLGGVDSSNDDTGDVMYIPVENVFIYPDFNSITWENDIALILLPTPFVDDDLVIATIPVEPVDQYPVDKRMYEIIAGHGFTLGWDRVSANSTQSPSLLQIPLLIDVSGEICRRQYRFLNPDTIICVEGIKSQGVCIGDTGGPLILNGVAVGVASRGISCREQNEYSIFTKLSYFCDWMRIIQRENVPTRFRRLNENNGDLYLEHCLH